MATVPIVFLMGAAVTSLTLKSASAKDGSQKTALVENIVAYLKGQDVGMREDKLKTVVSTVCDESQHHELDYRLALAVIKVESNFQRDVVSSKGARGLFQIKPSLAKYIAKDAGVTWNGDWCLHEPDKNIKLGVYHLSKLMEHFRNLPAALHAYNEGASKAGARHTPKGEPKSAFAKRVMKEYRQNVSVLPEMDGIEK
jgi:soluble lytic murein transglycosylase